MRTLFAIAALAAGVAVAGAAPGQDRHPKNDYPTSARADYVIGCLAANDFKRELLEKCSCGIDTIADMLTYDDYEKAQTVLNMQQGALGARGNLFRDTTTAKEEVEKLREAQAEVNLHCK